MELVIFTDKREIEMLVTLRFITINRFCNVTDKHVGGQSLDLSNFPRNIGGSLAESRRCCLVFASTSGLKLEKCCLIQAMAFWRIEKSLFEPLALFQSSFKLLISFYLTDAAGWLIPIR